MAEVCCSCPTSIPQAARAKPSTEPATQQPSKCLLSDAAGGVPWALGACHVGTARNKVFLRTFGDFFSGKSRESFPLGNGHAPLLRNCDFSLSLYCTKTLPSECIFLPKLIVILQRDLA